MLQYAQKEVGTMLTVFQIIQLLTAVTLITLTAVTQTKSEQGGGSMGWGTLGGKSSSSIAASLASIGRDGSGTDRSCCTSRTESTSGSLRPAFGRSISRDGSAFRMCSRVRYRNSPRMDTR